MQARHSVGLADLELIAFRIAEGSFENRPGCTLEVSSMAWTQNSFEAQQEFERVCQAHGIAFRVVPQLGGIDWVCP